MITIEELNEWLEERAQVMWPTYYRGLKDINKLDCFTISSIDWAASPLSQYLGEHHEEYFTEGFTGGCIYTRKNEKLRKTN